MSDILKKVEILEQQAKQYGFYWPNYDAVMQQIRSEILEVEELLDQKESKRLEEEIGDLLHAVISLCFYCGYSTEITLERALNKFEKRFNLTRILAAEDGLQNLHGKDMNEMMKYWKMAKNIVG